MKTSRMIKVKKRDGRVEDFNVEKLAGMLGRGLMRIGGRQCDARELARAVQIFLQRNDQKLISSAAVFEMGLKALRRIRMAEAAELLELNRTLRSVRRRLLRVHHEPGKTTQWDKSWLAELAQRVWNVSHTTGRILAAEVEEELLSQDMLEITREDVMEHLNHKVAQFGLADAVPVGLFSQDGV